MSGPAVTLVSSGGIPVKAVSSKAPAVTAVPSGGIAVTLANDGPSLVVEGHDIYFDKVGLLVGANSLPNDSTAFVDQSSSARPLTKAGNARVTTAQAKFGTSSIGFFAAGDYIEVPSMAGYHFDWASGPFTLEMWLRLTSTGYTLICPLFNKRDGVSPREIHTTTIASTPGRLDYSSYTPAGANALTIASPGGILIAQKWQHVAYVRDESHKVWTLVDGAVAASGTETTSPGTDTLPLQVGRYPGATTRYINGNVDEIRVTRAARYVDEIAQRGSYTVPTGRFPRF